jgi:hypothetical protein
LTGPSSETASGFVAGRGPRSRLGSAHPVLRRGRSGGDSGHDKGRPLPAAEPQRSLPVPGPLRGVGCGDPWERTHPTPRIPREIATHPFFFFPRHSSPTSFLLSFGFFCLFVCLLGGNIFWGGGQRGVRRSKHKNQLEVGSGEEGAAQARGPRACVRACVLRARPRAVPAAGPAWPRRAVSCCTGTR